jgi:hypothetical protein
MEHISSTRDSEIVLIILLRPVGDVTYKDRGFGLDTGFIGHTGYSKYGYNSEWRSLEFSITVYSVLHTH